MRDIDKGKSTVIITSVINLSYFWLRKVILGANYGLPIDKINNIVLKLKVKRATSLLLWLLAWI